MIFVGAAGENMKSTGLLINKAIKSFFSPIFPIAFSQIYILHVVIIGGLYVLPEVEGSSKAESSGASRDQCVACSVVEAEGVVLKAAGAVPHSLDTVGVSGLSPGAHLWLPAAWSHLGRHALRSLPSPPSRP